MNLPIEPGCTAQVLNDETVPPFVRGMTVSVIEKAEQESLLKNPFGQWWFVELEYEAEGYLRGKMNECVLKRLPPPDTELLQITKELVV